MSSRVDDLLIARMAEWMLLKRGDGESEAAWVSRVIYSGVGLNLLAALYDAEEDSADATVSMQHVFSRGIELAEAYGEILDVLPDNPKQWIGEIRQLYINSGYMLHRPNRLARPSMSTARSINIVFERGIPPWRMEQISGLGLYRSDDMEESLGSVQAMFRLLSTPIDVWWRDMLKACRWRRINTHPDDVEYASTRPQIGDYWTRRIPREPIVLCRTVTAPHLYALLRLEPDGLCQSDLPGYQVDDGQYRQIVLAMCVDENKPPKVTINHQGAISAIHLGYLLPRAERVFFELYSWPGWDSFHRTIATDLLPAIIPMFVNLGYIVREDS